MTKGRRGERLHPRRQVGEAATAGDDVVELGELLVAPMVAAIGDERARDVELLARVVAGPAAVAASGDAGRGGLGSTRPFNGAKASRRPNASRARPSAMSQRKAASAPARRSPAPRRGRAPRRPNPRRRGGRRRGRAGRERYFHFGLRRAGVDGVGELADTVRASLADTTEPHPRSSAARGRGGRG